MFESAELGHSVSGSAYDRAEYLGQRRQMMQTWADYPDSLKTASTVIPIFKQA